MASKYQRDTLRELREMGFVIDNTRQAAGSHLLVYVTGPTGKKTVFTIPKKIGDWHGVLNFKSLVKKYT